MICSKVLVYFYAFSIIMWDVLTEFIIVQIKSMQYRLHQNSDKRWKIYYYYYKSYLINLAGKLSFCVHYSLFYWLYRFQVCFHTLVSAPRKFEAKIFVTSFWLDILDYFVENSSKVNKLFLNRASKRSLKELTT